MIRIMRGLTVFVFSLMAAPAGMRAGEAADVLPPWTAVTVKQAKTGTEVCVWGRSHRFADAALSGAALSAADYPTLTNVPEIIWTPMSRVFRFAVGDECVYVYDVWVNPRTGEDARRCPQLKERLCHMVEKARIRRKGDNTMTAELQKENRGLRAANSEARSLLAEACGRLRALLADEALVEETPIEATTNIEFAVKTIDAVIAKLKAVVPPGKQPAPPPGGPTRQQGQFLAFIREYMMRNSGGVAPTHAAFQQFFNLTAPSVNSMLIRLERRGFIRRIPRQARGIELTVNPDWIPPPDRPFKFR